MIVIVIVVKVRERDRDSRLSSSRDRDRDQKYQSRSTLFQIFIHIKQILIISLHQMLEVVPTMFDTKFHPFNPLLTCLFVFINRYRIELLGY